MSYTLEDRLGMTPPMSWQQQAHVAVLACRGLAHLHSLQPTMVHRDFKSAVGRILAPMYLPKKQV
jgi:hypothetical protein